ncbi:amino acid adenylation domain-containing protein [Paraflavisolibacter sp. H34]|uniref:non-ribosomal peptide synthetase n=1 Tax=Huijunlia imazamoxiresistens TaxID=3127457 RepID=UPI0030191D1C
MILKPSSRCNNYQESLYFHWKQHPTSDAYHLPFLFEISGNFLVGPFLQSCQALFESLYAFGLNFRENAAGQVFSAYEGSTVPQVQFQSLASEEDFAACKEEFFSRPFDLNKGLTFYMDIIRIEATHTYYLLANCHHIISDAYSFYEIVRRLSESYNADNQVTQELFSISQGKYTTLNQHILDGEAEDDAFIRGQFDQVASFEQFRPDLSRQEGIYRETLVISGEEKRRISEFCRSQGITPFVFYLGCYHLFLHKVLQKAQLLTGIPVANRPAKEFRNVAGYFVNTLPLLSTISEDTTAGQLFRDLNRGTLQLLKHRNANVKEVLKGRAEATVSSSSLYDNIFTYYKQELTLSLSGCTVTSLPVHRRSLHCPFSLVVEEGAEAVYLHFEKDSRLLPELDMTALFQKITGTLPQAADVPLAGLRLVSAEALAASFQKTRMGSGRPLPVQWQDTIFARFEKAALRAPAHTACVFEGRELTYGELLETARRTGRLIAHRSAQPANKNVALLLPVGLEQITGIFSVLAAGRTYIPIDPALPLQRIHYILNDTAVSLVLTTRAVATRLLLPAESCLFLEEQASLPTMAPALPAGCAEDTAYIIYTSGTTGQPKGVMVPHRNVLALLDSTRPLYRFHHQDRWSLLHSYAFDFSVWEIFGALLQGGTLVIAPDTVRKSHAAFWSFLKEQRVTVLNQTPSYFQQLIKEAVAHPYPSQLRTVIFGGEKLIFNSLKNWTKIFPLDEVELVNMYGITETTVHVTYHKITQEDIDNGRSLIGKAIPGWGVCILGKDNQPLPEGATGEIAVTGQGVAQGYLNKQELTAQRFTTLDLPGMGKTLLYKSGDFGRINRDGNLEYFGRGDGQVKIRGYRIELKEIEKALQQHPLCDIAAVKVIDEGDNDQRLAGYYLSADGRVSAGAMRDFIREKLPHYMVPFYLVPLAAFPLTVNGKIDYNALPAPAPSLEAAAQPVLAGDDLQTALVKITCSVMKTADVRVDDNFFDLGGNSLLMVSFLQQVNLLLADRRLDARLQVMDVYEYPTIKGLLAFIEAGARVPEAAPPVPEEAEEDDDFLAHLNLLSKIAI